MSAPIAVVISLLAVVPFAVLVVYLVLRRAPNVSAKAAVPKTQVDRTDLLAEREEADFAAAAEQLKMRHANEAAQLEAAIAAKDMEEALIDWDDAEEQYRPPSIDPAALLTKLKISDETGLTRGEHRVFIEQAAMERINAHLSSNTAVELGGLLVGLPYYAPSIDAYLVAIYDGYAADAGKETAVSFEYTADTWQQMTPKLQEMPPDYVVVGSYHSHPGLGVFLSTTDIDTQINVFSQEWQVALVIDPIKEDIGFFISQAGVPVKYDTFA